MPTNAQLFEYEPFRHFCISIARSSYLVYNLRLSQTTKKKCRKIDTNAQWFHCSWSILLKRVNIRVRGFHLVFRSMVNFCAISIWPLWIVSCTEKSFSKNLRSPGHCVPPRWRGWQPYSSEQANCKDIDAPYLTNYAKLDTHFQFNSYHVYNVKPRTNCLGISIIFH